MRVAPWLVLTIGTVGSSASTAPRSRVTNDCAPSLAAYESAWRGTGEWRRVAPVRDDQEVSPTDSIGVWLERWHMPDGTTELRRVSATITEVVTLNADGCGVQSSIHRRTFDSLAMTSAVTDERLRDLLVKRRDGMVYVWSPGMPLSL